MTNKLTTLFLCFAPLLASAQTWRVDQQIRKDFPDQSTGCPGSTLDAHLAELQPPFDESFAPASAPNTWSTAINANRIDLTGRGTDGRVWHQYADVRVNEGRWSGWSALGNLVTDEAPTLTWHQHWLHFFAVERGTGRAMQLSWDNAANSGRGAWFNNGQWYPVAGDGQFTSGLSVAVGL